MIRAFVGAGGKTSLIKKYASDFRNQDKSVFVTTTTHMYMEDDTLLTDDASVIADELKRTGYVMAGIREDDVNKVGNADDAGNKNTPGKFRGLPKDIYEEICTCADEVLVEADGSRHLPLKYPAEYEPAIPDNADEIVVVCGMHGINGRVRNEVHRYELAEQHLGIKPDSVVTPATIEKLVRKGYVEVLEKKYPEKEIRIEAAGARSLYERAVAGLLQAAQPVSLIREEWFESRPKLVICGGGHVSVELVKMAACLDFRIKVIDDRSEFANPSRFPEADEVICDSFENLGQYLEKNAYYVVVTRGHKDDFTCVKTILDKAPTETSKIETYQKTADERGRPVAVQYKYLGMIGSRTKVANTFERLRNAGFSDRQIETIHAPVGLPINAVTPAEIAVSILAEIIQEKNSVNVASASQELLDVREHGVLCIIIKKTGSSPRGVGSMMFVSSEGDAVIDSIGGGAVEFAVIDEARRSPEEVLIKEYNLNDEKSRELGMICGGSNTVLFVPV